jgi:hypothetical protein
MYQNLMKEVNHLDNQVVKVHELKCAKLMTLLKPIYSKANIVLPMVPLNKPLSSYPLVLLRDSVKEPALDACRLFLLKARKNYRSFCLSNARSDAGDAKGASVKVKEEIQFITNDLVQLFNEWSEEEYNVRLKRKLAAVENRLETLKQFKIQLILTLHNRYVENGIASLSLSSAPTSSFWSFTNSLIGSGNSLMNSADYQLHLSLRDKFAFLDVSEPILIDSQGIISQPSAFSSNNPNFNRKGVFYYTLGNIMFYAAGTLIFSPLIVVIPMKIIAKVEILKQDSVVLSNVYIPMKEETQNQTSEPSSTPSQSSVSIASPAREDHDVDNYSYYSESRPIVLPLSALSGTVSVIQAPQQGNPNGPVASTGVSEMIRITDIAGQETFIKFTELTPDFIYRVFDILDIILSVRHHPFSESHLIVTLSISTSPYHPTGKAVCSQV